MLDRAGHAIPGVHHGENQMPGHACTSTPGQRVQSARQANDPVHWPRLWPTASLRTPAATAVLASAYLLYRQIRKACPIRPTGFWARRWEVGSAWPAAPAGLRSLNRPDGLAIAPSSDRDRSQGALTASPKTTSGKDLFSSLRRSVRPGLIVE